MTVSALAQVSGFQDPRERIALPAGGGRRVAAGGRTAVDGRTSDPRPPARR
ncbi:hypothetical protein [Kitasatospora sp. NPDC004289]